MRNRAALVGALFLHWIVAACGTNPSPSLSPTLTATTQRVQTPAPATAPAPRTSTTPAATATKSPAVAEVILRWDAGAIIADIDDVSAIVTQLRNTPGVIDGFGDEIQITILYDPQRITPDAIQRKLADLGYPTRKP